MGFWIFSLFSYQVKELILHFWVFSNKYIHILSISHEKCVFWGSNYVLKYRFLVNFANFRFFCQIAIRRPARWTARSIECLEFYICRILCRAWPENWAPNGNLAKKIENSQNSLKIDIFIHNWTPKTRFSMRYTQYVYIIIGKKPKTQN